MSEGNKALARRFFQEADRGRTPVELCTPGFTAHFPGPPPMDLEGFDQFEAVFRSAFSKQEHAIEDLVGEGDEVAVRLRADRRTANGVTLRPRWTRRTYQVTCYLLAAS